MLASGNLLEKNFIMKIWIKIIIYTVVATVIATLTAVTVGQARHINSLKAQVDEQHMVIDSLLKRRMTVQKIKELIKDEITKPQDRGITFKYDFICDSVLVDSERVKWCYNYDTKRWEFSLPASLFNNNIAAANHTLVIKASVFIGEELVLGTESEPVAIHLE